MRRVSGRLLLLIFAVCLTYCHGIETHVGKSLRGAHLPKVIPKIPAAPHVRPLVPKHPPVISKPTHLGEQLNPKPLHMDHPAKPISKVEHPNPHVEHPHVEHPNGEHPHVEHPHVEHPNGEHPHVEHPNGEHPHVEHPHVEHPNGEHPHVEHPNGEHPNGEHPHGEHPHGEHPQAENPNVPKDTKSVQKGAESAHNVEQKEILKPESSKGNPNQIARGTRNNNGNGHHVHQEKQVENSGNHQKMSHSHETPDSHGKHSKHSGFKDDKGQIEHGENPSGPNHPANGPKSDGNSNVPKQASNNGQGSVIQNSNSGDVSKGTSSSSSGDSLTKKGAIGNVNGKTTDTVANAQIGNENLGAAEIPTVGQASSNPNPENLGFRLQGAGLGGISNSQGHKNPQAAHNPLTNGQGPTVATQNSENADTSNPSGSGSGLNIPNVNAFNDMGNNHDNDNNHDNANNFGSNNSTKTDTAADDKAVDKSSKQ